MRVRCDACGGLMADVDPAGGLFTIRYHNGHHKRGWKMDAAMRAAEGHVAGVAGRTPGSVGVVEAEQLVELACAEHEPRHIVGRVLRSEAMKGRATLRLAPATNPFWWELARHPRT